MGTRRAALFGERLQTPTPKMGTDPLRFIGGGGQTPHEYVRTHCPPLVCRWEDHIHRLLPFRTVCFAPFQAQRKEADRPDPLCLIEELTSPTKQM